MSMGDWLTQKTSYNPNTKTHKTKTTKTSVTKIQTHDVPTSKSIKNENVYRITSQQNNAEASSIITYNYEDNVPSKGFINKTDNNNKNGAIKGIFNLSEGVLKILIEKEPLTIEQTVWFINNNLKLTKSITRKDKHCVLISFISEIKIKSDK